jgi:hypothetical protein
MHKIPQRDRKTFRTPSGRRICRISSLFTSFPELPPIFKYNVVIQSPNCNVLRQTTELENGSIGISDEAMGDGRERMKRFHSF